MPGRVRIWFEILGWRVFVLESFGAVEGYQELGIATLFSQCT